MMQVRCQRCGWMQTLGRESIALALAEAQRSHEQHHVIDCPRCRHAIKVPVADLRRRLPANYPLPEIAPPASNSEPRTEPESAPESAAPVAENQSQEPPTSATSVQTASESGT
jgi:DNA-directed RNA polymerase subunit RPC12/RpoP